MKVPKEITIKKRIWLEMDATGNVIGWTTKTCYYNNGTIEAGKKCVNPRIHGDGVRYDIEGSLDKPDFTDDEIIRLSGEIAIETSSEKVDLPFTWESGEGN